MEYKVFFDKAQVILSDRMDSSGYPSYIFRYANVPKLLFRLEAGEFPGLTFIDANPAEAWKHFLKFFDVIYAAGGVVQNPKGEVLFIYRRGIWDLPKGKLEEGESFSETALREVSEECGLRHLELEDYIGETYHVFWEGNRRKMKITKWYKMFSPGDERPVPQTREGIEKVEWIDPLSINESFNIYPNIKFLLRNLKVAG